MSAILPPGVAFQADVFDAALEALMALPGAIVDPEDLDDRAAEILARPDAAFLTLPDVVAVLVSWWKIDNRYVHPARRRPRPHRYGVPFDAWAGFADQVSEEWASNRSTAALIRTPVPETPSKRESHPKRQKGCEPTEATASLPVTDRGARGLSTVDPDGQRVPLSPDDARIVLATVRTLPPAGR